jgi:hypothetical protein
LGYSIPNSKLVELDSLGLGNTRAAQTLRRVVTSKTRKIALENEVMKPANQLAAARADDLDPVRNALQSIEKIKDDSLMVKKLKEFVAERGPLIELLGDINAYPKAAKVLNDFTTQKLAKALAKKS